MSEITQTPTRPRRGQDPELVGNPWNAELRHTNRDSATYLVRSASSPDRYQTTIHDTDADQDRCTCPARGHCHHIDAARLMQQIERVTANAETYYRGWGLLELQAEDARMRSELDEADSWLLRAQYGVVCDCILARLTEPEVA